MATTEGQFSYSGGRKGEEEARSNDIGWDRLLFRQIDYFIWILFHSFVARIFFKILLLPLPDHEESIVHLAAKS